MTDLRKQLAEIIGQEVLTTQNKDGMGVWNAADAIVAALPNMQWQPIETAPEDQSDVLIYSSEGVQAAWWCEQGYWGNPINGAEIHGDATHWMPLPAAPVGVQGGEE